jgi:L-arabinose isomerase
LRFHGLRNRLEGYIARVESHLEQSGVVVEALGMIDTPQRGREAGHAFRRADVDLLVVYVTTYALSAIVLPMVQRARVPLLLLSLQPAAAIDYEAFNRLPDRTAMTAEWLAFCSTCPIPEIANVLSRAQIAFHPVVGILGSQETWQEIDDWIHAARVKKTLAENRLGLMGHYYGGMLDIMTDLTQVSITFATEIEHLEVDELSALRSDVTELEIAARLQDFRSHFDVQGDCPYEELASAARTSVALDRFTAAHDLQSLAYYYKGSGVPANLDAMNSIIVGTSLLTARGIPVAGEYEVKNALAMKIMDSLGAGGSFTEFYALDLNADHVIMGHDGPGHIAIAEGRTKVRSLAVYHGKVGQGLSVEMSVKHGPVTLLSVVEDAVHGFKLLVAHGECVAGEILRIGNTNSHYRFPLGARRFVEVWNAHGPAHHCAVGIGHLGGRLNKLAQLLQIPCVQVT